MSRNTGRKALAKTQSDAQMQKELDAEYLRRFAQTQEPKAHGATLAERLRAERIKYHLKIAKRLDKRRKELADG